MRDPYEVLGVAKTATTKEIKSAYRKLAKKYHPDQNPEDPKAKERFSAATQAYDIIGDEKNRGAYDRGEIDAEGKPRFQGFEAHAGADPFAAFRRQGPGAAPFEFRSGGDAGDIFSELFGHAFSGARGPGATRGPGGMGGRRHAPPAGNDINATLDVSVEEVATAAKVSALFPDGRRLAVKLPGYVEEGQTIRLKGQGEQGPGGAGDALVKIHIRPHGRYRVEGRDLHADQPVPLEDAVLGAKVAVETPTGKVAVTVPAGSSSDKVLRLKGRGLPVKTGGHADLYVHVRVMLPEAPDPDLETLARKRRGG
jgi:DnaJ-class molecular chaperone